jgi:hypothetical protein
MSSGRSKIDLRDDLYNFSPGPPELTVWALAIKRKSSDHLFPLARFPTSPWSTSLPHCSQPRAPDTQKEKNLSNRFQEIYQQGKMVQDVRSVAVVGSGVIGSSWAYLFLSRGLQVIMSDPAPGAEEAFKEYVHNSHASCGSIGPAGGVESLMKRFEFVDDITPRLPEVDFVQEVINNTFGFRH